MVKIAQKIKRSNRPSHPHALRRIKTPTIDIKKYGGLQIAIVDGKIVATGKTAEDVLMKAKELYPGQPIRDIYIFGVPKSLYVIYYV